MGGTTGLTPQYLCNDIGRFPEVLTPANAGARQEVLDETHADVVAPEEEEEEKMMKKEIQKNKKEEEPELPNFYPMRKRDFSFTMDEPGS